MHQALSDTSIGSADRINKKLLSADLAYRITILTNEFDEFGVHHNSLLHPDSQDEGLMQVRHLFRDRDHDPRKDTGNPA